MKITNNFVQGSAFENEMVRFDGSEFSILMVIEKTVEQ